ncbi:MAG: ABC transporter substrate-binding protein [Methanothrix sp.]|nr:ABC transporter substrate-binding protein [Methanothrix sp.]
MRRYRGIALVILVVLATASIVWGTVPGDQNGDNIISQSELLNAENLSKDAKITEDQLEEIRHIREAYPRTLVDAINRTIMIYKPVKRIVVLGAFTPEAMRILNASDKIVGVDTSIAALTDLYPEAGKLPTVGKWNEPDIEAIIKLEPDTVLTYGGTPSQDVEEKLKASNIQMLRLNFYSEIAPQSLEKLGYALEKEKEAKEYIDFVNKYLDIIKSRTEKLSDAEKPKVFVESWKPYYTQTIGDSVDLACRCAGGSNIAVNFEGRQLDPEWVIEQNPDIILKYVSSENAGYSITNSSKLAAIRDEILNRKELATVAAVENKNVHLFCTELMYLRGFVGTIYFAKWFHPDLFEDLDVQAIHQEYMTKFMGPDYDLKEHGIFVFPPQEVS